MHVFPSIKAVSVPFNNILYTRTGQLWIRHFDVFCLPESKNNTYIITQQWQALQRSSPHFAKSITKISSVTCGQQAWGSGKIFPGHLTRQLKPCAVLFKDTKTMFDSLNKHHKMCTFTAFIPKYCTQFGGNWNWIHAYNYGYP